VKIDGEKLGYILKIDNYIDVNDCRRRKRRSLIAGM